MSYLNLNWIMIDEVGFVEPTKIRARYIESQKGFGGMYGLLYH